MLDYGEIDRAIAELEAGNTSFSACAKLADLYTVRENAKSGRTQSANAYSLANKPEETREKRKVQAVGDSEFLTAAAGKPEEDVLNIMDELMRTLEYVNSRAYNSVMKKIREL